MLSEREQLHIQIISDNELYPQAIAFIKGLGRPLPSTQINGLLNVSLGNTYTQLHLFVERQRTRKTWPNSEQHIKDFYQKLPQKLKELEKYVPTITQARQEAVSPTDEQAIKMELAREFIQHLLAENAYRDALRDFPPPDRWRGQETPQGRGAPRQ